MVKEPGAAGGPPQTGILPTFLQGLLLLVAGVAVALPVLLLEFVGLRSGGPPAGPGLLVLESFLEKLIVLGFALWLGKRLTRMSWRQVLPLTTPTPGQAGAFAVLLPGTAILAHCLGLPFREILPRVGFAPSMDLAVLVLAAPLTEEPFFRGLLLQGMLRRYRPWKAVLLASLLFSLWHLVPRQLVPTFVVGVSFAWVVVRTGSLWLPLVGHALHNAGVWALEAGLAGELRPAAWAPGTGWYAAALLGGAALVALGAALLVRATRRTALTAGASTQAARVSA